MNDRWLGGTLTNWATVSNSIKRLRDLDDMLASRRVDTGLTKKELLKLQREQIKLQRVLGGIRNMGGLPDLMFVIDTNKEAIAVKEARKLGIPVVAIIDTNCDPQEVDFPIPGNDDAARAIQLYCNLIADAVLDGMSESSMASGQDPGASETVREPALAATSEAEAQA
jgi:small subunit ribosomal protein S2